MAEIEGRTLAWARKAAGYPGVSDAVGRIGYLSRRTNGEQDLIRWEKGEKLPTVAACRELAKAYMVEYTVFYLPPEKAREALPDLSKIDDFRSEAPRQLTTNTIRYLREVIRRQDWLKALLAERNGGKADWFGKKKNKDSREVARWLRKELRCQPGKHWELDDWIRQAEENLDVCVMQSSPASHHHKVEPEFSGCALHDERAPVIALNSADSKAHRLFTLAHELAHLAIGRAGISRVDFRIESLGNTDKGRTEQFCNSVAAEVLMPMGEFKRDWNVFTRPGPDEARAKTMAEKYKVSFSATVVQALKCGLIARKSARELLDEARLHHKNPGRESGASSMGPPQHVRARHRTGPRLARLALMAYNEGRITPLDLWDLFRVKLGDLPQIAKHVDVPLIYWHEGSSNKKEAASG